MISQPTRRPTTLIGWLHSDYRLSHEISKETTLVYHRAIRVTQNWADTELNAETVSDAVINGALLRMIQAGRSPHYARSVKTSVAAVWRDMADAGLCDPPRKLRAIRTGKPQHTVWTHAQVAKLIEAACQLSGQFRTLPLRRAPYFESLIRTAWDTGLRRRDLHLLRTCDVAADWTTRQHKTQKPIRCRLRPTTLDVINTWGREPDEVLWPLWGADETFRQTFTRLVEAAGLPHGPFKTIRKSAGTAAEAVCPGAGHLLLGNTRAVFERHYLDVSQVLPPRPPEIG